MKRINPKTKALFRAGDVRDDGFIFVRYLTNRPLKRDGTFVEDWKRPSKNNDGKVRINPETQKPLKRGDRDLSTGKIFWGFDSRGSDKNGYRYEVWCTPNSFAKRTEKANSQSKAHKAKTKQRALAGELTKRLNPSTGMEFKRGERDELGRYFLTYTRHSSTNGFIGEEWGDYDALVRRQIANAKKAAKERAEQKNIKFSVSHKYLCSIYPDDVICPIFKTKMEWLGDSMTSPSLDRIVPNLGYIEGNVAWVSKRANTLKLDRSPETLRKIANWIDQQLEETLA